MQNAKVSGITKVDYEAYSPASIDELESDSLKAAGVVSIYYYHADHLGTNTLITDMSGNPSQFFLNLPFGETMVDQRATTLAYNSPYKFNGKELDEGTGMYYYGARYYDPRISVWMSVDPMAEKYPNVSSFSFCLNNPVLFMDPNGKDIIIYYQVQTKQGTRYKPFVFNGKNQTSAPKNEFVQNVIAAYDYNTKNGGGKYMKEAAEDRSLKIRIMLGEETDYSYQLYGSEAEGILKGTVVWNPKIGLETTDSKILSPATILEEEFDHAVDDARCHPKHWARQQANDQKYGNKEERRVAEGSVSETASKNDEVPGKWIKPDHNGKSVLKDSWKYQKED